MKRLHWLMLGLALSCAGVAGAAPKKGEPLPAFALTALDGQRVTNKALEGAQLGVLYFFSTQNCPPCRSGLEQLRDLADEYADARIAIVAIGRQDAAALRAANLPRHARLLVAPGDAATLNQYNARVVAPTTYIVGPDGRVLEVMQGGGASTEAMLVSLAEKQLSSKQPAVARRTFEKAAQVSAKAAAPAVSPTLAQAGVGYSLLKEGKLDEAEKVFTALTRDKDRETQMRGREGLAEVLLARGQAQQALRLADEVIAAEPKRVAANLIRARAQHQAGQAAEASTSLARATDITAVSDFSFQRADAHIAKGNLQRKHDPKQAVAAFQAAVAENPLSVEALSNLGAVLQDTGEAAQALDALRKANLIDPADKLLHGLLRQVQASIAQRQDLEKQRFIDESVRELLARQKERKPDPNADDWTSPPMLLSVLGIQEEGPGSLTGRAGVAGVLQNELYQALAERGIQVVERALLDKLLSELKLGSSDLADPESQLRLGRILAARLLATGSLFESPTATRVALRLIDTESSALALSSAEALAVDSDPAAIAAKLADAIAGALHRKYPLKGRIASVSDTEILLNLGRKHGLRAGQSFNVLGAAEPVVLGGKVLGHRDTRLGHLEVVEVQDGFALAKAVERSGVWQANQRVIQRD